MIKADQIKKMIDEAYRLYPDIKVKSEADMLRSKFIKDTRAIVIKFGTWVIENLK